MAVNRINEIISNGMKQKQSRFSTSLKGPRQQGNPRFDMPPPANINRVNLVLVCTVKNNYYSPALKKRGGGGGAAI